MLWLVVIYAKDLIQDLPLADPTMQMARNIVEDAKSISSMMAYFVLVAVWRYERHRLIKKISKST